MSRRLKELGHEVVEDEIGPFDRLGRCPGSFFGAVAWVLRYPRINADVVVAEEIEAAFVSGLARHVFGGSMVLDFTKDYYALARRGRFRLRAAFVWLMERIVPLWADIIITTDEVKARFVRGVGVSADRIVCVPQPVDTEVFAPGGERRNGVLLHIGLLDSYSRVEVLVEALAVLSQKDPGLELWLAGEGSAQGKLERLVEELGLGARVKFLGRCAGEELAGLIRSAEIMLFPVADGSARELIEALSCGKPLVVASGATRKTSASDEILPPECAVKAAPTPEDFASGISLLRAGPMGAEYFGACARKLAARKHDWKEIGRKYERVLACAAEGTAPER